MQRWKQNEVEQALNLIKDGLTYEEISIILFRSADSIRNKLSELNCAYRANQKQVVNCLECGINISKTKSSNQRFCSNKCSITYYNKNKISLNPETKNQCLQCGKVIASTNKFCSNLCQGVHRMYETFEKIENGDISFGEQTYKKYLIHKYGEKCMECGWAEKNAITDKVPIQLEHIDGNSENNSLNNIKLLCPNCHSLTPTFGALNKGNGRKKRREKRTNQKNE